MTGAELPRRDLEDDSLGTTVAQTPQMSLGHQDGHHPADGLMTDAQLSRQMAGVQLYTAEAV